MYKLIIVDDEEISREGFAKVVNWKSLGFKLTGVFNDGLSTIEYIKENEVDVILTDIKMGKASGIDVAKTIFDLNKETRVIFMSAYKDFEYARQAIMFNVEKYLLKPISMEEVKKTFSDLKEELDEKKKIRQGKTDKGVDVAERLKEKRVQFFANIAMGTYKDEKYLRNCFERLQLPFDFEKSACCILEVNVKNYQEYLSRFTYGKDGFNRSVDNLYLLEEENLAFYPIIHQANIVRFVVADKDGMDKKDFLFKVKEKADKIKGQMKNIMNLSAQYKIISSYNSILELAIYNVTFNKNEIEETDMILQQEEIKNMVKEWQKSLLTNMLSLNREMVYSIIKQLKNKLYPLEMNQAKAYIIDFIAVLKYQLNENDIKIEDVHYKEALQVEDKIILEKWLKEYVEKALSVIEKSNQHNKLDSSRNFAKRAKQYIDNHLNDDLSLESIADYLFISPVYFSRLFKEQTKENYIDYVIKKRIESAKCLLEKTDQKIYEVCYSIGYSNVRYFYKLFKKQTGLTPSQYRIDKREEKCD